MSKKYVPSGYQIINLDLSAQISGTPFTPETEDEILLYDLLNEQKAKKPILLCIVTPNVKLMGFTVVANGNYVTLVDYSYTEEFTISGTQLSWTETEL